MARVGPAPRFIIIRPIEGQTANSLQTEFQTGIPAGSETFHIFETVGVDGKLPRFLLVP